jgi:hypothetical protein
LQAVSLSPEIRIVVDSRITPNHRSQSRRMDASEGSSPWSAMASEMDTTGVVRAGHAHKGITRELERARCFHAEEPGGNRLNKSRASVISSLLPTSETREHAWYRSASDKQSAARRASGSLSRS